MWNGLEAPFLKSSTLYFSAATPGVQRSVGTSTVTPPTGLNLFVVKSVSGFRLGEIIRGSIPFCLLFYVLIALLYMFPQLALWMSQGLK